jgi:hypothetical protein
MKTHFSILLMLLALNAPAAITSGPSAIGNSSLTNSIEATTPTINTWYTNSSGSNLLVIACVQVGAGQAGLYVDFTADGVWENTMVTKSGTALEQQTLVGGVPPGGRYAVTNLSGSPVMIGNASQRIYSPATGSGGSGGGGVSAAAGNALWLKRTLDNGGQLTNLMGNAAIIVDPVNGVDATAGRYLGGFKTVSNAVAAAQDGDTVYLVNGTHNVTGQPNLNTVASVHFQDLDNVTLNGDPGAIVQIVNTTGPDYWGTGITWRNCTRLRITGIRFKGDMGGVMNSVCGLVASCETALTKSIDVEIDHCVFEDAPDQGITHTGYAQATERLYVHDNLFLNVGCIDSTKMTGPGLPYDGDCISGLMASDCRIISNIASNVQGFFEFGYGGETGDVYATTRSNLVIAANTVYRCLQRGILVGGVGANSGYTGVYVSDNKIYYASAADVYRLSGAPGIGQCIGVFGGDQIFVRRNLIHGWTGPNNAAMMISGSERSLIYGELEGNVIINANGPAIWAGLRLTGYPGTTTRIVARQNRIYTADNTDVNVCQLECGAATVELYENMFVLGGGTYEPLRIIPVLNGDNGGRTGATTKLITRRNIVKGLKLTSHFIEPYHAGIDLVWDDNTYEDGWSATLGYWIYGATWNTAVVTMHRAGAPTGIYGGPGSIYYDTTSGAIYKCTALGSGNWVGL